MKNKGLDILDLVAFLMPLMIPLVTLFWMGIACAVVWILYQWVTLQATC